MGHRSLLIQGVDRGQAVDQREMGAGQGARGHFRLDHGADRGQFFDTLGRKFGCADPP